MSMKPMRHGGMKAAPKAAPMATINAKPKIDSGLKNVGLKPTKATSIMTGRGAFKMK
jgi:hypothetical protein